MSASTIFLVVFAAMVFAIAVSIVAVFQIAGALMRKAGIDVEMRHAPAVVAMPPANPSPIPGEVIGAIDDWVIARCNALAVVRAGRPDVEVDGFVRTMHERFARMGEVVFEHHPCARAFRNRATVTTEVSKS